MAIRLRNIAAKSLLKNIELQFETSSGQADTGINLGIVPVACRLKEGFFGTTASSIAYSILVKVNNVDISNTFAIAALAASGGVTKVLAPASAKLITAGSLISIEISSTADIAKVAGSLILAVDKSEK